MREFVAQCLVLSFLNWSNMKFVLVAGPVLPFQSQVLVTHIMENPRSKAYTFLYKCEIV